MSIAKIHEAVQDGHHFANEIIDRIKISLDEMENETARAAFKEEFIKQLTELGLKPNERSDPR